MFCTSCGSQIPDGAKFCGNCGAKQPQNTPVEPQVEPQAQVQPEPEPQVEFQAQPEPQVEFQAQPEPQVEFQAQPEPQPEPQVEYRQYEQPQFQQTQYQQNGQSQYQQNGQQQYQQAQYGQPYYQADPYANGSANFNGNPPKKKGKKIAIAISLILFLAALAAVGYFVIWPMIDDNKKSDDKNSADNTSVETTTVEETTTEAEHVYVPETETGTYSWQTEEATTAADSSSTSLSSEYDKIFEDLRVPNVSTYFVYSDTASFALAGDGMCEQLEFGCDGDVIKKMVDTIYISLEGLDTETKEACIESLTSTYATFEEYAFCTVTIKSYDSSASYDAYCIVKLEFNNLTDTDNIQALITLGMVEKDSYDYLSLSTTETQLTANGYVKK